MPLSLARPTVMQALTTILSRLVFGHALLATVLVAFLAPGNAMAQATPGLGDMLFPKPNAAAPQALRYSANGRQFTLDRSFPKRPLLRFDGDPEVYALTSVFGARGDEFLRSDTGVTMLRITSIGGVVAFGPLGTLGAPAELIGPTRPVPRLRVPEGGNKAVATRVQKALQPIVGAQVKITLPSRLPTALSTELLDRVTDGMRKARLEGSGPRTRVVRVREVRVVLAAVGGATLRDNVLWIGVSPSLGYAGRPSSEAVKAAFFLPPAR